MIHRTKADQTSVRILYPGIINSVNLSRGLVWSLTWVCVTVIIIRLFKLRGVTLSRPRNIGNVKNVYKIVIGMSDGKILLREPRLRWDDNIKWIFFKYTWLVAGCCGHCNEHSSSIIGVFLTSWAYSDGLRSKLCTDLYIWTLRKWRYLVYYE